MVKRGFFSATMIKMTTMVFLRLVGRNRFMGATAFMPPTTFSSRTLSSSSSSTLLVRQTKQTGKNTVYRPSRATAQHVRPIFSLRDDEVGGVEKKAGRSVSAYVKASDSKSSTSTTTTSQDENDTDASSITAPQPGDALNVTVAETAAQSSSVLAVDPSVLDIISFKDINKEQQAKVEEVNSDPTSKSNQQRKRPVGEGFVKMFRGSANYIANHRNTCAVYHIPGSLLEWSDNTFRDLMDDIALTWLLGMKVTLIAGCRHQIDKRLQTTREEHHGICVTDANILRLVKEEAGYVRFEVERQLARSLRLHGGLTAGNYDGNVVSGNFYSAQPFGVLEGVDYKYTGFVRRVEVEKIRDVHRSRDICLLTTLGVSPSGEVFNVNSESLAATVAGALDASKIIFFTEEEMVLKNRNTGKLVQNMRLRDVQNLLTYSDVHIDRRGFAVLKGSSNGEEKEEETDSSSSILEMGDQNRMDMILKMGWAMKAVEQGVKRAHIIAPTQGALLQELYTRDGSGTLISRDLYEGIRRANVNDVAGIADLISPLIQMGTLVDRPKAALEKDIDSYFVYTRDSLIVACGQLKRFENGFAEIGCLVVAKEYRKGGRGDAMLGYLERMCVQSGASKVFVLSTQTMEWFLERGFQEVNVDRLPPSRKYNSQRNSKIYMKQIESDRDLDAAELWWNR
mmetsp:Transcript_17300/g.26772  ORF Transcript_17300/g.26772 Transcript_17300/m.26772 type:complete len:680 (-) Transcript_17300:1450-3489(-)